MNPEVTMKQYVEWLRSEAVKMNAEADAVEARFSGSVKYASGLTAQRLRDYLGIKAARPSDLAKHFQVPRSHIQALIDEPGSQLSVKGNRGWVSVESAQPPKA